jgi:hypothetical protein
VIEELDDESPLPPANRVHIEAVATPHPSLPLKGGGDESEPRSFLLNTLNRTAVVCSGRAGATSA